MRYLQKEITLNLQSEKWVSKSRRATLQCYRVSNEFKVRWHNRQVFLCSFADSWVFFGIVVCESTTAKYISCTKKDCRPLVWPEGIVSLTPRFGFENTWSSILVLPLGGMAYGALRCWYRKVNLNPRDINPNSCYWMPNLNVTEEEYMSRMEESVITSDRKAQSLFFRSVGVIVTTVSSVQSCLWGLNKDVNQVNTKYLHISTRKVESR